MDEHFVRTERHLFRGQVIQGEKKRMRDAIASQIAQATDDEVLNANAATWAEGLAQEHKLNPPRVDIESASLERQGRVKVDCTNAPGISYTTSEWGNVVRDGFHLKLHVPATGNLNLLMTGMLGAPELPGTIEPGEIVCEWAWPEVKGAAAFEAEIQTFKNELRRGLEILHQSLELANLELERFAIETIESRRSQILAERDFLGELTIPVTRVEEEPQSFEAPPPIKRVETPARKIKSPDSEPPARDLHPQLDEFYGHILSIIRAVARGLERSPGSFSGADEEALRDQLLVTLNTHYRGATYAEAFNRNGKTDILIRVYDRNAFIGECKWWTGPKAMEEALEQLFGYTTWQDSRVALIFYVPTKAMTATIEKARAALEGRDEFLEWLQAEHESEIRCRVRWPGDPERVAVLTSFFVHLPRN